MDKCAKFPDGDKTDKNIFIFIQFLGGVFVMLLNTLFLIETKTGYIRPCLIFKGPRQDGTV